MSQATVREATPAEAARVAGWFELPEFAGLDPDTAARRFAEDCSGDTTLRVLVEGDDILAAVRSTRIAAEVNGARAGVVLAQGGAPAADEPNASVPILLRGVLRQYKGAALVCVTAGVDPKSLKKMGFAPFKRGSVTAAAAELPRLPSGARCRPAFPIDFDAAGALRSGGKALLRLERSAGDWRTLVDRWRSLAGAGAAAPDAHVVLRDDERLAYLIVRPDGDTLQVLEAAGDGDAIAGAAGALARGRGLAAVTAPHNTPGLKGASEITAAKASEVTWAGKLAEDVDLEAIAKAGEPLSGAERL
ncbi:MAG: hypothetical protein ACYTGX_05255 [Planctomycetota bacterium]|jgi:hypothetical protein